MLAYSSTVHLPPRPWSLQIGASAQALFKDQSSLFASLEKLLLAAKSPIPVAKADAAGGVLTALYIQQSFFFTAFSFPILRRLFQTFPWLATTLRVLFIRGNAHDEAADMESLVSCTRLEAVSFPHCGITSIEGLQRGGEGRASPLRHLDLCNCKHLASLVGLDEYHAYLEKIDITGSRVTSLAPLTLHCPMLQSLQARYCPLSSLEGFEKFVCLEALDLAGTAVASILPLQQCHKLCTLNLHHCRALSSLDGLNDSHTQLENLCVGATAIPSLALLRGCHALIRVIVSNCTNLSSLEGLEKHAFLEEVNACETSISSLIPLQHCVALKKISVNGCRQLTSLEGLPVGHGQQNTTMLEEIDAAFTGISNVRLLNDCKRALKRLFLSHCRDLASLEGLEGCEVLEELDASYTPIPTVDTLFGCTTLRNAVFSGCWNLTSLDGLADCTHLEELFAAHTPVSSIRPLERCPALRKLDLSSCHVLSSLEGLAHHEHLEEVRVSNTAVTSLEPLLTCPALQKVYIRGISRDAASLEELVALKHVEVFHASVTATSRLPPRSLLWRLVRRIPLANRLVTFVAAMVKSASDRITIQWRRGHAPVV